MTKNQLETLSGTMVHVCLTLTLKSKGFEVMSDFPFNIYFPLESKYMSLAAFSGVKDQLILVNTDDKEI